MRIAVFGATGRVGSLFIKKALAARHSVVGYARAHEVALADPRISVVLGELNDRDAIEKAVEGADVVVVLLGPVGYQDTFIFTPGYEQIIAAMKKHGVRRLLALGTPTNPDPTDRWNPIFWGMTLAVHWIIGKGHDDMKALGRLIAESGLDWTLVRVPLFTDGAAKGNVKTGAFGAGISWPFITREDIADFFMAQLTDRTYIGRSISISN